MTNEERAYNYASKQKASKFQIGEIAKFYNDGYQQAEDDLELSWEDMECIIKHYQDIMAEKNRVFVRVEDYKELLKRYKDYKERKDK